MVLPNHALEPTARPPRLSAKRYAAFFNGCDLLERSKQSAKKRYRKSSLTLGRP